MRLGMGLQVPNGNLSPERVASRKRQFVLLKILSCILHPANIILRFLQFFIGGTPFSRDIVNKEQLNIIYAWHHEIIALPFHHRPLL
jgi:hypothetical protein